MVRVSQIEEISQKCIFKAPPSKCNIDSQGEEEDVSITGYTHCGYRSHKLSGGREEGGGSLFMTAG